MDAFQVADQKLANQLGGLMISNTRLQSQLEITHRERALLEQENRKLKAEIEELKKNATPRDTGPRPVVSPVLDAVGSGTPDMADSPVDPPPQGIEDPKPEIEAANPNPAGN